MPSPSEPFRRIIGRSASALRPTSQFTVPDMRICTHILRSSLPAILPGRPPSADARPDGLSGGDAVQHAPTGRSCNVLPPALVTSVASRVSSRRTGAHARADATASSTRAPPTHNRPARAARELRAYVLTRGHRLPDRGPLGSPRRCARADGVLRATSTEALDARAFPRIEMRTPQMRLAWWRSHRYAGGNGELCILGR